MGNITVSYATSLGDQGAQLASQMLSIRQQAVQRSSDSFRNPRGTGHRHCCAPERKKRWVRRRVSLRVRLYHGGDLYLDATFASTISDPLGLEVGLYVAELSESFMGPQNKGWSCGWSNGEALSRFCAEQATPAGTLSGFATGPAWDQAGRPDWISKTEQTDGDDVSTGCGIVYIYWMLSLGFSAAKVTQAGGATLSANYKALTGKDNAYTDVLAALKGVTISSDNPFGSTAALTEGRVRPGRRACTHLLAETRDLHSYSPCHERQDAGCACFRQEAQ